jgi:LPS sulfotransferase NodH
VKADQTQLWWSIPDHPENRTAPQQEPWFNLPEIQLQHDHLETLDRRWREFFAGRNVEPLCIVYEDFIAAYEATILSVFRYLGLQPPRGVRFTPHRMVRQSDEVNEDWVRRYHAQVTTYLH